MERIKTVAFTTTITLGLIGLCLFYAHLIETRCGI